MTAIHPQDPDLVEAVDRLIDARAAKIRAQAADDTHAANVRRLHEAGYNDAAEFLRGAR